MRHRRSFLSSFCLLLVLIFSSEASAQSAQVVPIKIFFPGDSSDTGATKGGMSPHPARIAPILIDQDTSAPSSQQVEVTVRAPAAQEPWVTFHVSATQWEWNIRRPGEYAAQSVVGSIIGNVDILISFSGFEDLKSSNAHTGIVEAYYAASVGIQTVEEVDWATASDFNKRTLLIKQDPDSPIPVAWGLWNRVYVKTVNSATEYSDDAVITFVMQNTSPWIDPELPTGK
jgi:hypothetical protein